MTIPQKRSRRLTTSEDIDKTDFEDASTIGFGNTEIQRRITCIERAAYGEGAAGLHFYLIFTMPLTWQSWLPVTRALLT